MNEEQKKAERWKDLTANAVRNATPEELNKILLERKFTLGELTNIKKYFEMMYSQAVGVKNEIRKKLKEDVFKDDQIQEALNTVDNIYGQLLKIEQQATVIQVFITELREKLN